MLQHRARPPLKVAPAKHKVFFCSGSQKRERDVKFLGCLHFEKSWLKPQKRPPVVSQNSHLVPAKGFLESSKNKSSTADTFATMLRTLRKRRGEKLFPYVQQGGRSLCFKFPFVCRFCWKIIELRS